jgi:DUF917 family protein
MGISQHSDASARNPTKVIPYEIGGAATASAVATAAWLDVPVLDADFVGRSVPEATQMLPALYGLDLCPTAGSDAFGNETIIHKALNRHITERLGKYIASASFGLIGQATLLRKAGLLRPYMLAGTLSRAYSLGQGLRLGQESDEDVDAVLSRLTGSRKLFEGLISEFVGRDVEGYYVGDITIEGRGETQPSKMKIWFKNENHIAWLNGDVCLTSPDLISILDRVSSMPCINSELRPGLQVAVYGTRCHEAWYRKETLAAQSPRYYGFDFDARLLAG